MKLFGKKENEEEEVQEEFVPRKKSNNSNKTGKGENPPSLKLRRTKKEPPKPWGRKERILVFAVVLITAGASGFLSLSARAWKLPGLPRIKAPSFMSTFFGEETIILEGDSNSIKENRKAQEINSEFRERTKNLSGVYGLYVIHLDNGFSYGVNEFETFQAASLIKLPVIAAMYMEAEKGNINLDEKYVLKNSDKVGGAGSLYGKPAGYEITYRNLLNLMGKQSDNTAFSIVKNLLGDSKIESAMTKIGMTNTNLGENETTLKDVGVFFEELWKANVVKKSNRDEILESLTDTLYEAWLAAGVPDGVRVAHKYGREVHVVNDAGIIYSEKPFVVVIMSKGVVEREADEIFPELSNLVYEKESEN